MPEERITIMGIGNPLMRDEGIGIRVVETLMTALEFPPNVTLVDAGTMGMTILNLFQDCDYMLVVDAIEGTGEPAGTVVRLSPENLAPNQVMHSLHDVRLPEVLQAASLIGGTPETIAIGIQIEEIAEWVMELSEPVENALPVAAAAVLEELAALGVLPTPRTDASIDADIIAAVRSYAPIPEAALRPDDPAES